LFYADAMSVTVSFRVPKELKEKMDRLRNYINWSEELRKFVEMRIREFEQERAIEDFENIIKSLPQASSGTAARYVREDRDSG